MNAHVSGALQFQDTALWNTGTVEDIRRKYLNHEACVKSIGTLYVIGSLLLLIAGTVGFIADTKSTPEARLAAAAFLISLSLFQLWVAGGLKKLASWTKIPVGVLSGIGLLAFPLGTVINAYILYLVFSQKGQIVLSQEYKRIIALTPHIKYRTSIAVWILLGILVAIIMILLLGAMLPG